MRILYVIGVIITLILCVMTLDYAGADVKKRPHFRVVTNEECQALQQVAQQYGIAMLDAMAEQWKIPQQTRAYIKARCHLT